jgi:hypothetical protein
LEAPSDESVRRAARVLGLVPKAALLAGWLGWVARAVSRSGRALGSSAVLYGLAPALVLTGAIVAWRWAATLPPASSPGNPGVLVNPAPAEVSAPATATPPASDLPTESAAGTAISLPPTKDEARALAPPAAPRKPNREATDSVREQLALVDRARKALGLGDVPGALRELDRYDRDFPSGMLSEEVLLLRVEALAARGDRAGSEALARRFLAAYPRSVHAGRVRAVLAHVSN